MFIGLLHSSKFFCLLLLIPLSYPNMWLSWSCRERYLFQSSRFPSPLASPMRLVDRQTSLAIDQRSWHLLKTWGALGHPRSAWVSSLSLGQSVFWLVEKWHCFCCKNLPTAFLHLHIPGAGSAWDLGGFVLIGVCRLITRLGHRVNHWHKSWSRHFGHVYRHLLFIIMVVPWQSIK